MEIDWPQARDSPALSADKLDVWAVRLDHQLAQLGELVATLSAAERQRAEQFRLCEPQQRFIITRIALRSLLGKYLGLLPREVILETDPNGKPRLAGGQQAAEVHFNVAHSGGLALIAVTAGCEVGVDVERVRTVSHAEQIAQRYFHPTEVQAILEAALLARDAIFLRCWTRKEAVLKAIGCGVTGSLASFRVPTDEFNSAWIELPATLSKTPLRCWLHELVPCSGYVGAVACLGEARRVHCFSFDV